MTVHVVAIVGAGIGAEHLAAYRTLPERFRVKTLCDLDAARAAPLLGEGTTYAGDMAEVLADPEISIVDICLPPHLHLEAASAALKAGKHVVCEKPLVTSLADADLLTQVAGEAGRRVFPVFQYRFGPGTARLRALLAAGLAGRPLVGTLETHWNRGAEYYAIPWRGTWAGEQGGAVLGHAIHIHDLLTDILGPIASVHAELATRVNEIETEDCGALALRLANGALVTSSITLGAAEDVSRMRLVFDRLTVESGTAPYALAQDGWTFTARDPEVQPEVDRIASEAGADRLGFEGLFAAIADALDGRPGREVTLDEGRRSLEFVTAIYASARAGTPVTLPLAHSHPLYTRWHPPT
ncbi:MAG: Gfo/Idh/MocA family oxidoreductase [Pseudomonadota bacterium]